jgi:hypothetical protein
MVLDGINSTLAEFGLPYLYTPSNPLRLLTGLLSGIAIAPVMVWLLGAFALPRTERSREPVIRSLRELVLPLALGFLFILLVMQEYAVLYYPIALVSVIGVVAVLTIAAFLVILLSSRRVGQITRLHQIIEPGALAVLVACGILSGTALLR